jgi:hypothetical protein
MIEELFLLPPRDTAELVGEQDVVFLLSSNEFSRNSSFRLSRGSGWQDELPWLIGSQVLAA